MIRKIMDTDIGDCVQVIRESFLTVAKEFHITMENAPRFAAFATTVERLEYQLKEGRPMFAYYNDHEQIIGYYSLYIQEEHECELNNLCVLPEYRQMKIGEELLKHAFNYAKELGCYHMNIGIVDENIKLKNWYETYGAEHIGTKKFDFFPFTCGYMKKDLNV